MRNKVIWAVALGLVLVLAGAAEAQDKGRRGGQGKGRGQGGRGGGFGGRGVTLVQVLSSPDAQADLKLSDAVKTKVTEFATAQREKQQELFTGGFDQEKFAAFQKESATAAEKFVKDNLNADQQKRA